MGNGITPFLHNKIAQVISARSLRNEFLEIHLAPPLEKEDNHSSLYSESYG